MRNLHVISSMDPTLGGVCQAVRTMIQGMGETGTCHNEVVTLDAAKASFLAADPFPVHALGPAKTTWAYSAQLLPWLIDNLPRFDSIIIHGLWQYPASAVRKALDILRDSQLPASRLPRCYVMPHGMLDPYFQQDSSRRLKSIRNTIYWKLIERKVVNQADGLLFTCEEEKLLARKPFRPYRPKREWVVGLGVEESPDYTVEMKTDFATACPDLGAQPYLLFLSRIHPKKGVDSLIRAYAALPVSHTLPGSPIPHLVIAGPLDSSYAHEMQQLAAKLLPPLSETEDFNPNTLRIHFPGMLSGAAKWGAFHGCEAFVLPSHQENFGIAVVEALACGKPVLISKQVNIWREIVAVGGGIVADDNDAGTLALLQTWIALSSEERQAGRLMATNAFRKHFSIPPAAERMKAILNR